MERQVLLNHRVGLAMFVGAASLLIATPSINAGGPNFIVGDIPPSLKELPIPEPVDLMQFVRDRDMAVVLGKALFWDTQVGSDSNQACATCHYHAGVDNRILNTQNPAANGSFDGPGPGQTLTADDYPTFLLANPNNPDSTVLRNFDDITGSQGVVRMDFLDIVPGVAIDLGLPVPDPVFNDAGVNTRQVTGRNTPSMINAVFNVRNFWDGRANNHFNGNDPFGVQSSNNKIWVNSKGIILQETVDLENSALASQAVGPPNSDVEMAWAGRTFPDIGRKLITLRPLAQQIVHSNDGTLGSFVHASGLGLDISYEELIQQAFRSRYWNPTLTTPDGTPLIEANFALFWGLAVQSYVSTLVSDDSPFDQFMDGGGPGGLTDDLLTDEQKLGLDLFRNVGQISGLPVTHCGGCHAHTTFSSATITRIVEQEKADGPQLLETPIEQMLMTAASSTASVTWASDLNAPGVGPEVLPLDFEPRGALVEIIQLGFPGTPAVYADVFPDGPDTHICPTPEISVLLFPTGAGNPNGFNPPLIVEAVLIIDNDCNDEFAIHLIGVLPGFYDVRIDGVVRANLLVSDEVAFYDQGFYNIGVRDQNEDIGQGGAAPSGEPLSFAQRVRDGFSVPEINVANNPSIAANDRIADIGAFKTPILRNVELTGPYFHNGGIARLENVLKFYDRGGDFRNENRINLHPNIGTIGLSDAQEAAIIAFMIALTDERVKFEMAPFDHPEIQLPNGDLIPATGALGLAAEGLPGLIPFADKLDNAAPSSDAGISVQFETTTDIPSSEKSSQGDKMNTTNRRKAPNTAAVPIK